MRALRLLLHPSHRCVISALWKWAGGLNNPDVGHIQREHETAHGSMQNSTWSIPGDADASVEVEDHKFGIQDSGSAVLCSMVCKQLGRHAHIEYCRTQDGPCSGNDLEHIENPMLPNLHLPKDWVTHKAFWKRSGTRI